jgi:hypothetical protein
LTKKGINLVEREMLGRLAGKVPDTRDCDLGGVIEVVNGGHVATGEEQLEHSVAANVARAARDQYGFRHFRIERGGEYLRKWR